MYILTKLNSISIKIREEKTSLAREQEQTLSNLKRSDETILTKSQEHTGASCPHHHSGP